MFYLLASIAGLMVAIERLWPGQALPSVRHWGLRLLLVNAAQLGIVILVGFIWDKWLDRASLFHISDHMGALPSAFVTYFIATFVYYWWHRLRHESSFFWKLCHQLHHSVSRIEVLASFYKHPVEIFINSIIGAVLVYTIMGCSVTAAAWYTAMAAIAEYFYHWNVKTPRWIGWLVQRPESHRVHHQHRHHTQNFADLPIWDMLFGTFYNPEVAPARCGFDRRKEDRVVEMLAFQDVHKSPAIPAGCLGCRKRWACHLTKGGPL